MKNNSSQTQIMNMREHGTPDCRLRSSYHWWRAPSNRTPHAADHHCDTHQAWIETTILIHNHENSGRPLAQSVLDRRLALERTGVLYVYDAHRPPYITPLRTAALTPRTGWDRTSRDV